MLENIFHLKENHTDVKTEIMAGITLSLIHISRSAGGASAQKDGQAVKLAGLGNVLPVAAAAHAMDIH